MVDRGVKFEDYALHGVAEYWLIHPEEEFVEQYILMGDRYELFFKSRSGNIQSRAIQGLLIPLRAIFDPAEHLAALQSILA
jgi:Uma2 family endonuclease